MNTIEQEQNTSVHQEQDAAIMETALSLPSGGDLSLLDGEGAFTPEWYRRFEELAPAEKTLAKFKRPEALAKSYAELEKMKSYPEDGDPGRMALFRSMVGLPEQAEEFSIERPEGIAQECWDEQLAGRMAGIAYECGVPPAAMKAIVEEYGKHYSDFLRRSEEEATGFRDRSEEKLRQDWGDEFEDGRTQALGAVRLLSERAGIDPMDVIDDPGLSSNPSFVKMMREVSRLVGEAPMHRGDNFVSSPADEAGRIESDPSHPLHDAYMNSSHPNHRYANEVYDRLAFGRKGR